MAIIERIKEKIKERRAVLTFCMNQSCCNVVCRYNAKRSRNPKSFAFFENTYKCKRVKAR